MVRSKLAAAILSASLALPGVASALGIGEYTLKSYLNQPLELEIGLVQTRDLSTEEVIAALAGQAEFDRAGVERLFFLSDMRFEIRQNADGTMSVVARTSKPVTEPFLNFLVEVQWPQGRLLREYTILLDPPVYKSGAAATATAAPVSEAPAPAPVARPPVPPPAPASVYVPPAPAADSSLPPPPSAARQQATAAPRPAPVPQADAQPASAGPGEYRVQASDTMWDIAARNRAGSASVQQTMMAIQRANPDAFIQGNVNLVKKGYVLRIPGEAEALEVGTGDASRQFADQTRVWREMLDQRAQTLPSDDAQLQGSGAARPAAPAAKGTGSGEVTLVAPAAAGGTKGSGGKDNAALQNKLAIAEEGLDKAARENKELASRLADLDKQVKSSEKLLAMKSDEIATLQAELDRIRKEKGVKPGAEKTAAVVEKDEPAEAAQVAAVEAETAQPVAEPSQPASPAKEKPVKAEKTAKVPPKEDKGGSLLLPLAGLAVLLGAGGAGFWFWRRKKAAAVAAPSDVELEEVHDAEVADDLAQLQDLNLAAESDESSPAHAADSETADPMGEADMYMAYGRFQQAADILYAALQREPDRADFRVKLAEVYAEMGDYDAAREQATLAASGSDSAARVQAGSLLAKLGGGAAVAASVAAADESMPSLDDLAMEFAGGHDEPAQAAATAPDSLDSLDLDFDAADAGTSGDESLSLSAEGGASASAEESLDFSLDDMELPSDDSATFAGAPADVSQTAVRPREELPDELSLDDADFGEFTLDEEAPAQETASAVDESALDLSDEFSLDSDFSLDESALEKSAGAEPEVQAVVADASLDEELSLDDADLDFSPEEPTEVMAAVQEFDQHDTVRTEAVQADDVTAVQPAADLDLESELADLQSDLSGEGVATADSKGGDDFDFLADSDENATKLDLAKAYIDMGDAEGARDILNEVVADGNDAQKAEASRLLGQVG